MHSFNLTAKEFSVVREASVGGPGHSSIIILYKAARAAGRRGAKETLGYIRFDEAKGTVDIVNRKATLHPGHLDLGGTSKTNAPEQAGSHGEGLKLALLVLMRGPQNHAVMCRSGGFTWQFDFTKTGHLVTHLIRMPESMKRNVYQEAYGLVQQPHSLLPFAPVLDHDVHFIVGGTGTGRDESGGRIDRVPVCRHEFDDWVGVALFLSDAPHGGIISTPAGDLLTAPQFRGKLYLKGLLLEESTPTRSASVTNLNLKFGYSFAAGKTHRERKSVEGAGEESAALLSIWSAVLRKKPEMVEELSDLLNAPEPGFADVCDVSRRRVRQSLATRLKNYLFGEQFAGKWYYSAEDKDETSRHDHILKGLQREGVELKERYWKILREHRMVRTAEEEEQRLFKASPIVNVSPDNSFAEAVQRLLRSCLRVCKETKDVSPEFVKAGNLRLPLFYSSGSWYGGAASEARLLVHDRYLSLDGASCEVCLDCDAAEEDVVFSTALDLFTGVISQLRSSDPLGYQKTREEGLIRRRLLDYQRMGSLKVKTTVVRCSPGLRLEWAALRSESDAVIEVQCHLASECSDLRDTVLLAEDARSYELPCSPEPIDDERDKSCRCLVINIDPPPQEVTHTEIGLQDGLQEGETYFFILVNTSDDESFVGLSSVSDSVCLPPSRSILGDDDQPSPPASKFTLGNRLETFDILDVDSGRFYDADNPEGVRAVIAIMKGEKKLADEMRKRRRIKEECIEEEDKNE
ncbi:hypothetical protein RB595_004273 [Gaeumannomyces hyphopodioides]